MMRLSLLRIQIISLFPGLLSCTSSFTRAVPPLHEIPDIGHLTKGDEHMTRAYCEFLLDLLLERSADITDDAYRKVMKKALMTVSLACLLLLSTRVMREQFYGRRWNSNWCSDYGIILCCYPIG